MGNELPALGSELRNLAWGAPAEEWFMLFDAPDEAGTRGTSAGTHGTGCAARWRPRCPERACAVVSCALGVAGHTEAGGTPVDAHARCRLALLAIRAAAIDLPSCALSCVWT